MQCVSTRAPSGTSIAPWRPRVRFISTSSSWMPRASSTRRRAISRGSSTSSSARSATPHIRSTAHARLTAVGRAALSVSAALASAALKGSGSSPAAASAAIAMPYAALMPIAGAPRTTISRIAVATASAFSQGIQRSSLGSARCSRRCSVSSSKRMGVIIRCRLLASGGSAKRTGLLPGAPPKIPPSTESARTSISAIRLVFERPDDEQDDAGVGFAEGAAVEVLEVGVFGHFPARDRGLGGADVSPTRR